MLLGVLKTKRGRLRRPFFEGFSWKKLRAFFEVIVALALRTKSDKRESVVELTILI